MSSNEIIFVSAGMLKPKKRPTINTRNFYLNYGLLGLASIVHRQGYKPKVYHGCFEHPFEFIKRKNLIEIYDKKYPIFLSVPSFYAVGWAKEFLLYLRRNLPEAKIVVGGRWVTDGNCDWVLDKLGNVDLVVYGTAEDKIVSLLDANNWTNLQMNGSKFVLAGTNHTLSCLDYSILDECNDIPPSIEVSRGCGAGCDFCVEGKIPIHPLKTPKEIGEEISNYSDLVAEEDLHFYFEASNFRPSEFWLSEFEDMYLTNGYKFTWRCETRIGSIPVEFISRLAKCGLKVLDIGLESGSELQLMRMKKTNDPLKYLKKAKSFICECTNAGVWPKLNIMLYAGETRDTINETVCWLDDNKDYFKGVSVGPLKVYGCDFNVQLYLKKLAEFGSAPTSWSSSDETGITDINLSDSITYELSEDVSKEISRRFMSAHDYYLLKKKGYYRKQFNYDEFLQDIQGLSQVDLPFTI